TTLLYTLSLHDALPISTSPPPTTHLIAVVLKALTGLPWVADFRDPWIEEGFYPLPGTLRYRVETILEQQVIRCADRVTVTTPYRSEEHTSELQSRFDLV